MVKVDMASPLHYWRDERVAVKLLMIDPHRLMPMLHYWAQAVGQKEHKVLMKEDF